MESVIEFAMAANGWVDQSSGWSGTWIVFIFVDWEQPNSDG